MTNFDQAEWSGLNAVAGCAKEQHLRVSIDCSRLELSVKGTGPWVLCPALGGWVVKPPWSRVGDSHERFIAPFYATPEDVVEAMLHLVDEEEHFQAS